MISLSSAFWAGLLAFFSSCLTSLLPLYFSYIVLFARSEKSAGQNNPADPIYSSGKDRWLLFRQTCLFSLGFISFFIILGVFSGGISRWLIEYRSLIQKTGALLLVGWVVLQAVSWLGIGYLGVGYHQGYFGRAIKNLLKLGSFNSFILGAVVGISWTPCIGPVLALILLMASQENEAVRGGLRLFIFGLGLSVPFLIISLFFDRIKSGLKKLRPIAWSVQIVVSLAIIYLAAMMWRGELFG